MSSPKTPSLDTLSQQLTGQVKSQLTSSETPDEYAHLSITNAAPVELWNPEFCGDMDLVIKRNGDWLHEGNPIKRHKLVEQFSKILKKENDDYYLVTPVEKVRIQVEYAPLFVTQMQRHTINGEPVIVFIDNGQNHTVLCEANPLWVETDPQTGEPSPYVRVRGELNALLHRNVYYELVELAVEKEINGKPHLMIRSAQHEFSLGSLEP